jgi:integrase
VRAWCDAAGLPECSAHGLRKAGATALAYAGATEPEIAAFLGHKGTQEAATYVKAARCATLSDNAMDKLEAKRRAENVSNLTGEVGQKGA